MGGPNLEVFKFGMYIMFPIGIMYYFGTNLDSRFSVPDFWPKPHESHKIPFEKEEINEELERLKRRRLAARAARLELERRQGLSGAEDSEGNSGAGNVQISRAELVDATSSKVLELERAERREGRAGTGWFVWGK